MGILEGSGWHKRAFLSGNLPETRNLHAVAVDTLLTTPCVRPSLQHLTITTSEEPYCCWSILPNVSWRL